MLFRLCHDSDAIWIVGIVAWIGGILFAQT